MEGLKLKLIWKNIFTHFCKILQKCCRFILYVLDNKTVEKKQFTQLKNMESKLISLVYQLAKCQHHQKSS